MDKQKKRNNILNFKQDETEKSTTHNNYRNY